MYIQVGSIYRNDIKLILLWSSIFIDTHQKCYAQKRAYFKNESYLLLPSKLLKFFKNHVVLNKRENDASSMYTKLQVNQANVISYNVVMLHLGLKIQPIVYRFLSNIARVYIDVRDFYIQYYISTYTQVSTTHYSKRWFATVVRTAAAVHYVHRYYTQVAVRIPHRPSVRLSILQVCISSVLSKQSKCAVVTSCVCH